MKAVRWQGFEASSPSPTSSPTDPVPAVPRTAGRPQTRHLARKFGNLDAQNTWGSHTPPSLPSSVCLRLKPQSSGLGGLRNFLTRPLWCVHLLRGLNPRQTETGVLELAVRLRTSHSAMSPRQQPSHRQERAQGFGAARGASAPSRKQFLFNQMIRSSYHRLVSKIIGRASSGRGQAGSTGWGTEAEQLREAQSLLPAADCERKQLREATQCAADARLSTHAQHPQSRSPLCVALVRRAGVAGMGRGCRMLQ